MKEPEQANRKEVELTGRPASPGRAIGFSRIQRKKTFDVESTIKKEEVLDHINEFKKARSEMESELSRIRNEEIDDETKGIIDAQIQMVNDPDLEDQIEDMIKNNLFSAGLAIQKAFDNYIELISGSDNEQFRERSIDISDLRDRLVEIVNQEDESEEYDSDCIVIVKDLSPRQVIGLKKQDISGIVVEGGGTTSHAAIIARSVGLPTVVGVRDATKRIPEECKVAIDGTTGEVVVCPSGEKLAQYKERIEEDRITRERVYSVVSEKSVTKDGHPFSLRANIEFAEELEQVKSVKAEGVGLLRAESIYLERKHFQDIRMQKYFYKNILEGTGDHPVTIRLFDAGGDKIISGKKEENNPFLGWRGIRMLLDEQDLLHDQLRAILTVAGQYPGRVRILAPMVTLIEEVQQLKEEIKTVGQKLQDEGVETDPDLKLGIMVEVPSVALQAEKFIRMVDFLSIGTNDLTQYTLAVDRGNGLITHLYDQRHPVIWQLIRLSVEAAHNNDKEIALCGELASDPVSAACLLGMGVRDLSMTPSRIPHVKDVLINRSLSEMQELSGKVFECDTTRQVDNLFNNWSQKNDV